MFSFFERKPPAQTFEPASYDMAEPIPAAIAVTADIIERKLDKSRSWTRKARTALKTGDLHKYAGFLVLARKTAEEAVALMESADLLHEEILNQAE
jgi:phage shock protein A